MSTPKQTHARLFVAALICSVISSLSLLAALLVNGEGRNQGLLILSGLLFWGGLVLEQVLFWTANHRMKQATAHSKRPFPGKPGMISLPEFPEGLAVDLVFAISLVAFLVCAIGHWGESLMQYVFICLTVLAFRLHCFLNGKNYRYKKLKERKVDRNHG